MLGKNLKDAVTNACAFAAMVGGLLTIGGQNNFLPKKCFDAGVALVSGAGVITSFCTGKSNDLDLSPQSSDSSPPGASDSTEGE
jgi:hypothetical protein